MAPSVHNVQPVRWAIDGDRLIAVCDNSTVLPHADPAGHDILVSVGASVEGAVLAASALGLKTQVKLENTAGTNERFTKQTTLSFSQCSKKDKLASCITTRASWRGPFAATSAADRRSALTLTSQTSTITCDEFQLEEIGQMADRATFTFMNNNDVRNELLSWMRLRRGHPQWSIDGLNADAMNMNFFEAAGAFLVLGKSFEVLSKMGLAKALVSEARRYKTATGIMVVHCPANQNPVQKGRTFYREWLRLEQLGFAANVVSALADHEPSCASLHRLLDLPGDQKILTALLFGRRPTGTTIPKRARLPLDNLIVDAGALK